MSVANSISVEPIAGKTFGAVVSGVSLATLTDGQWKSIEDAFHKHALLIFPGQFLPIEAQVNFAKRLGELEFEANPFGNQVREDKMLDINKVKDQVIEHGRVSEHSAKIMLGTGFWHSDSTYYRVSAKAGMLSAKVVPSWGGQTGFADMRAAYDALDESTKEYVGQLAAYHSNVYSQANDVLDFPRIIEDQPALYHPFAFLRPLVKVHPVTGRRSLQIGRHAFGIPGLERDASRKLLNDLCGFACQGPRTYEHNYQEGDFVLWDNRCTMHRSLPFDYREPRSLIGTRVAGNPVSECALDTPDHGRKILAAELCQIRLNVGLLAQTAKL